MLKLSPVTKVILAVAAIMFLAWSILLAYRKQTVERLKREVRQYEQTIREKRRQEALQRALQQAPAAAEPLPTQTVK